jgi:uncharacterized protein (TIGR02757 family)
MALTRQKREFLLHQARHYESSSFLEGDPSWFMHQVEGSANQEVMALLASVLSYGARPLFLPKIEFMLQASQGQPYHWVKSGAFVHDIPDTDQCYYRLYTCHTMNVFLHALKALLDLHGTLGEFMRHNNCHTAATAVAALCAWFAPYGLKGVIPQDTTSSCKRVCMFLRWMVRDNSPVDLGLWRNIIDKRSLIIPMDAHVVQQALALKLIKSRSTSMANALRLTDVLRRVFPDDPLKGDFALFGTGIGEALSRKSARPSAP